MRPPVLAVLLSAVAASLPMLPAGSYRLVEGGILREFEVDCTTLVCRPQDGVAHLVPVTGMTDGAAMRSEAARLERNSSSRFDLRLFEKGKPRKLANARWLARKIRVELGVGADPVSISRAAGASAFRVPHYAPQFVILDFPGVGDSLSKLEALRRLPGVVSADPLLARKKFRRFTPNDPEFAYSGGNPDYQWHLRNTGQNDSIAGLDVNVSGVWDTLKGSGVTIAIVDDGLEVGHPDLAANANTAIDHDWNDGTPDDPTPGDSRNDHGTNCAGVAAARGNNGVGVSGAAPEASLVGLRLIAGDTTDEEDGEAIAWRSDVIDISSNSWGPDDSGEEFFVAEPLISAAFADGVANGRGGKGTIYVWAAGNGGDDGDYSNYDGYNNRIETISVGAVAFDGRQPEYSESGANLLVCAPSDSGFFGEPAVTTTTLTANGSYTDEFGGTSAATPLVAGVLALVLEKNPDLGWRDVQEILVRSAEKVDASDPGWSDNAAGFHFNHKYGAGMIDAAAAVALADGWTNLPAQQVQVVASAPLALPVPDNHPTGVSHTLSAGGDPLRVEHVQLTVDIDHSHRGNLEISLTSPSGTVSQFSEVHADSNDHIRDYTFLSVRQWGEASGGDWVVRVADRVAGSTGTVNSLSLKLYGTSALSGYELWASTEITAGKDATPGGDPECDRRTNLLEYALRSNPLAADRRLNEPTVTALGFEFEADTSKTDLSYTAQSSTDLKTWTPLATTVVGTVGTIETRRASIPASASGRVYLRLEVQKGAP